VSRKVRFERAASRDVDRLPREVQRRVVERIVALAEDPFGAGTKPLQGNLRGLRSVRVGDWRITYQADDPDMLRIIEISNRRDAYKRLGREW
jgi:mRNA interferase RelE/StbE